MRARRVASELPAADRLPEPTLRARSHKFDDSLRVVT
jgi:hypothetical protein